VFEDLDVVRDVVSRERVLQDRTDDADALVAGLASPRERLGEVRRVPIAVTDVEMLQREEPSDEEYERRAGHPWCP
jgi:hypothetical protein